MVRVSRSPNGFQRLRIWDDGDWPTTTGSVSGLAVEWARIPSIPTSYALLGGQFGAEAAIDIGDDDGRFDDSPAGWLHDVHFGLDAEYQECVLARLTEAGAHFRVTLAAQSELGSSVVAFSATALFLLAMLERRPTDDDSLWLAWDQALQNAARR